jgi:predicted aspartyl protease
MIETRYLLGFPFATINLKSQDIECMIDTGFDGALLLPLQKIQEHRLQKIGFIKCTLANGSISFTDTFAAEIDWLDKRKIITVIGMEADFALIGMQLLADVKATLLPRKKILTIESA